MSITDITTLSNQNLLDEHKDRTQFNKEVRLFKSTHQVKLKDLFKGDKSKSAELREKFWTNPAISNYFSRSYQSVNFTDYHPDFNTKRQDKEQNDYYESRIYQLAKEHHCSFLPYRQNSLTDEFYISGTRIRDSVGALFTTGRDSKDLHIMDSHDIENKIVYDIYQITKKIISFQYSSLNTSFRFVISPNIKDEHATTLVTVLEKESGKILTSIFINSSNTDAYFENIHTGFNLQRESSNQINEYYNGEDDNGEGIPSYLEKMYQSYKKDPSKELIHVDEKSKTAYVFCSTYLTSPGFKKVIENFKRREITTIHELRCFVYDNGDTLLTHLVQNNRPIPFLNASHQLQIEKEDMNCVLYTYNMITAISKLLESPKTADRIYALALRTNNGKDSEQLEAEKELVKIFQEEVKRYLPSYYDEKGHPKPKESIKEFHLKQRWELGSLAAQNTNYLSRVGFLPEN